MVLKSHIISLLSLTLLCSTTVSATSFTPDIDWRNPSLTGLCHNNASCTTASGIMVEAIAPSGAVLYHDSTDGFGVIARGNGAYERDEIEGPEIWRMTLPSPLLITGLFFSDLFHNERSRYSERLKYSFDNSPFVTVDAIDFIAGPGNKNNGEVFVDVAPTIVTTLSVMGFGRTDRGHEEGSVVGINVTEPRDVDIATPGSFLLALSALSLLLFTILNRSKVRQFFSPR